MKLGARLAVWCVVAITLCFLALRLRWSASSENTTFDKEFLKQDCYEHDPQKIGDFLGHARGVAAELALKATDDLQRSATVYRERRGRHPPPGFGEWYKRAKKQNALIPEDFFDQIYIDLEPFWSLIPNDIRATVSKWSTLLKLREGKVVDFPKGRFRVREWAKMIGKVAHLLPDLDLPLNGLDEPKVMVPWETANSSREVAFESRSLMMSLPLSEISQTFDNAKTKWSAGAGKQTMKTSMKSYHDDIKSCCAPGSKTRRQASSRDDRSEPDRKSQGKGPMAEIGPSKDLCNRPELLDQHGFLIEPATVLYTTSLIPIFSSNKLNVNGDILLPEPAYYGDNKMFTGKDFWGDWSNSYPWNKKKHGLIWRGAASGGTFRAKTSEKFHRHRFVAKLNGSLASTPQADEYGPNSDKDCDKSAMTALLSGHSTIDASFTKLFCSSKNGPGACDLESKAFDISRPVEMRDQAKYKYLPDIDGNTLSGRFQAFMRSNSAVIKSTIFTEWHDARLVPWSHYIPLDIGFGEVFSLLKYFLGYYEEGRQICAHDIEGERIAQDGRRWTNKVLRKEDMELYALRVLLEYARIVDDGRDKLGFVGDLVGK